MIVHRIAYQDDHHVVTGCNVTMLVTRDQVRRSRDLTLFRSVATCMLCNDEESEFPPEALTLLGEAMGDVQSRTVNNALTVNDVAERIAMIFHEHYEMLAPRFSYSGVKGTQRAWEDLNDDSRNLMVDAMKGLLRDARVPLAIIAPVRLTSDDA